MDGKIKVKKLLVAVLAVLVLLSGSFIGYRIVSEVQRRNRIVAAFAAEAGYDKKLNERYIAYYDENSGVSVAELAVLVNNDLDKLETGYDPRLISFINAEGYEREAVQRYLDYSNSTGADEATVVGLVSHDVDQTGYEYGDRLIEILNDKYFIWDRVARYCQYDSENAKKNFTVRELVERVNCNLDMIAKNGDFHADTSKGPLVLVNNYYDLDEKYIPADLVDVDSSYSSKGARMNAEAYKNLVGLIQEARKAGLKVTISGDNGYRSYSYQSTVYDYYCKMLGREEGEKRAAQPGYSEHQTGLAADLAVANISFKGYTKAKGFNWLAENCHKYGYIVRYPEDKTKITGYTYERWHFRYVGKEAAEYIHETGITFDEYYAYFVEQHQ